MIIRWWWNLKNVLDDKLDEEVEWNLDVKSLETRVKSLPDPED